LCVRPHSAWRHGRGSTCCGSVWVEWGFCDDAHWAPRGELAFPKVSVANKKKPREADTALQGLDSPSDPALEQKKHDVPFHPTPTGSTPHASSPRLLSSISPFSRSPSIAFYHARSAPRRQGGAVRCAKGCVCSMPFRALCATRSPRSATIGLLRRSTQCPKCV